MKILRVAQKLYPEHKGGGAYHVHAMSRDQAERGHEITMLTVSDDASLPRREERDGYTIIRRNSTVDLLGNDISIGVAKFLKNARDYDVIHAHSHLYFSTNLAALKRRLGEIPLAITNHGLFSQTAPKRVFDAYLRTFGRWTFNQATVVFTYTEPEQRELRDIGVTSGIEVIANGIDTERFTPEGPRDEGLESPAVLFVGRLVEGKRPLDAVRALAQVHEHGIDATLYIAGTGPLQSEMQQVAAKNGILDSIVFLEHVPYDTMPKIYRAADVLVLPSRDEGLPRTVLEAMAVGTPVVTSDLEQLKQVVGSYGNTVPVGETGKFANAISDTISSLADTERENGMSTRLLPKEYEWEATVEKTTQRLESISRDSRAP